VNSGANVTFSVSAAGDPPLHFQWEFNGVDLPLQIGRTLTINSVTEDQAGEYRVQVKNTAGSETSQAARLSVNQSPIITTQPQSQAVLIGGNVTFSVVDAHTDEVLDGYLKAVDGAFASLAKNIKNNSVTDVLRTRMKEVGFKRLT